MVPGRRRRRLPRAAISRASRRSRSARPQPHPPIPRAGAAWSRAFSRATTAARGILEHRAVELLLELDSARPPDHRPSPVAPSSRPVCRQRALKVRGSPAAIALAHPFAHALAPSIAVTVQAPLPVTRRVPWSTWPRQRRRRSRYGSAPRRSRRRRAGQRTGQHHLLLGGLTIELLATTANALRLRLVLSSHRRSH